MEFVGGFGGAPYDPGRFLHAARASPHLKGLGDTVEAVVAALNARSRQTAERTLPGITVSAYPDQTIRVLLPEHYERLRNRAKRRAVSVRAMLAEVVSRGLGITRAPKAGEGNSK